MTAILIQRPTTGQQQQSAIPSMLSSSNRTEQRRFSAALLSISSRFDHHFQPAAAAIHQHQQSLGELRRPSSETERSERKKARMDDDEPMRKEKKGPVTGEQFPDRVWALIGAHSAPLEQFQLARCNRRLHKLMTTRRWEDVQALEIRPNWPTADSPSACSSPPALSLVGSPSSSVPAFASLMARHNKPKRQPRAFRVRLRMASGRICRMRTVSGGDGDAAERLLKSLLSRIAGVTELTLWDACIGDRFRSILLRCCLPAGLRCLRLWNCGRWLDSSNRSPALLLALLASPSLRQLLLLNSQPLQPDSSACRWLFSKHLARAIVAPLEQLQLTNCRLPLRSMELLVPRCGSSLRRLAIGCTFGKEQKRAHYLGVISQFTALTDLDLPPFLFHLRDQPQSDELVHQLFQSLPRLRVLGFRHFNSSALFRFIEFHLPRHVRALRVYHNAHRVPNFAELGLGQPSAEPSSTSNCLLLPDSPDSQRQKHHQQQKKYSLVSRCSLLSSSDSLGYPQQGSPPANQPSRSATFCAQPLSISPCSSISSWSTCVSGSRRQSARAKSFSLGPEDGQSIATESTWLMSAAEERRESPSEDEEMGGDGGEQQKLLDDLAGRRLTIFAIAEERQASAGHRRREGQQRLRKNTFAGVDVFYVSAQEAQSSQEVLGRMACPIQSPFVYTTGQSGHHQQQQAGGSSAMRVIRGDLVRAIPLASLGMESDWESEEENVG